MTHDLDHDDILINHSLPKSRTRTNVVTAEYTPRGRLFGGYTTRGTGVTHATFRFPEVLKAIVSLSFTRPKDFNECSFSVCTTECRDLSSCAQRQKQSVEVVADRLWRLHRRQIVG